MTSSLTSVTLEVTDLAAAERFYADAFGLTAPRLRLRAGDAPTEGFRGFTMSITVARPSDVDSFLASAVAAGATTIKPAAKSLWGYGGVVQAPDGTIWKLATSAKKDAGPATREIGELVLLLGVEDVKATKQFYVEQGLTVGRSFGSKYVEFAAEESSPVKLALYKRRALAKDAGVPVEGSGSHRLALGGTTAAPFTDPDGFAWEATASATTTS
ncbi:glyoxalase [Streptomyces sp. Q6]|uniref:Glyoxalase n=1 Tax=Streptomyces citrinus TaxID=3118173 RepID=A0ACD5ACK7_9ACTN